MAGRTVNKPTDVKDQTKTTQGKGFSTDRPQPEPSDLKHEQGNTTEGTQEQIHSAATSGLSLVLTNQIRQAAEMVSDAERFTADAARALAKRSHRLASGQTFADHYVRELNALCEAEPFGGFGQFNWEQAHELLEDLGKPALPSPTPKFLPNA
jgi:hypothetical protein